MTQILNGRVGLVPRGNYAAGVTYQPLDVVTHNNMVWACLQRTATAPSAGNTAWVLLLKGLDAFPATAISLGGVKIGEGLNINAAGLLSVAVMEGSGLVMDSQGRIYFDPGQMPTDQFEALLKAIRVPIWVKGHLTLYVRADGNDANNGLANTPAGAKKTVQGAVNELVDNYNLSVFNCTIQVGPGHFPSFQCSSYSSSTGRVTIKGAGIDVTFIDGGANEFRTIQLLVAARYWTISDLTVTAQPTNPTTVSRGNIIANSGSDLSLSNVKMVCNESAATALSGLTVSGGTAQLNNIVSWVANGLSSGSRMALLVVTSGGVLLAFDGDYAMNGTCRVAVLASSSGRFGRDNNTDPVFSGSLIGKRYEASLFGQISTHGGGANYFPGSIAGSVDSASFGIYQ